MEGKKNVLEEAEPNKKQEYIEIPISIKMYDKIKEIADNKGLTIADAIGETVIEFIDNKKGSD